MVCIQSENRRIEEWEIRWPASLKTFLTKKSMSTASEQKEKEIKDDDADIEFVKVGIYISHK